MIEPTAIHHNGASVKPGVSFPFPSVPPSPAPLSNGRTSISREDYSALDTGMTSKAYRFEPNKRKLDPESLIFRTVEATNSRRTIEKLAEAPIFRDYQRAFVKATGLPLHLRAVECWHLAESGHTCPDQFYHLMGHSSSSVALMLQMQQEVCNGARRSPCTKTYPFGLVETAIAIKVGEEIVGYLLTGHVFLKPPTRSQIRCVQQMLALTKPELATDDILHYYIKTPVWQRANYQACIKLLQFFADQLGTAANQILLQQTTAEPWQIARARQFITEHYRDKLSLADLSRRAGMCTFYFSKKFKQVTGLNFTDFVSRLRVEQAKKLLLNRNFRVSEIGFEVGFQSLTHFNRKFKKIAGCSPKEYRQHLPTI
jgi:AraC-like DNA-binding protein